MASEVPDGVSAPTGPEDGPRTVEDLLAARLRQLGVRRTYGLAVRGLDHVPVEDPDVAVLLADADGRLGHDDGSGRLGAATLAGPILHLSSAPGGTAPLQTVGSVEELVEALADPPGLAVPGTSALHLDLDLNEPIDDVPLPETGAERVPVLLLDPSLAGLRILVLAGPGVVRTYSHTGLRNLTRAAGAPVLSTFGAIGLERWDSPFHAGVGGLQADDLALGGLDDADLVITTGLDPAEVPPARVADLVVQDVPPRQLGVLLKDWPPQGPEPTGRPSVRAALAPFLRPLWEAEGAPLTAARAALHLSGALPDRGVVAADPGPAGFWVARATPSSFPGAVCVPATAEPGFAAAAALVAALDGRPCLAVTDPVGAAAEATGAVLDLAAVLGHRVAVQVWGGEGDLADAAAHVALLESLLDGRGPAGAVPVPVELEVPEALLDVAGPVVAWPAE
ncbi:hypothetical protein [Dermatobacter hominis]|uniref:hypothetical protein n=1 Tax=Dermatobacter hominis TaxID=2884263 RepID=UPI001D12FCEA|nr:hypothetical protein [Dermatobacter hominis]UDY37803.1 hypothetical protein LH044_09735 [Dermatobacter hominis]